MINSNTSPQALLNAPLQPSIRSSAARVVKSATQKRMLLPFPSTGPSVRKMCENLNDGLLASPAQLSVDLTLTSPIPIIRAPTLGRFQAANTDSRQIQTDSSSQSMSVANLKTAACGLADTTLGVNSRYAVHFASAAKASHAASLNTPAQCSTDRHSRRQKTSPH